MEDQKKKLRQLFLTDGLNQQNLEGGKLASKAKSLIFRNIPESLCCVLLKLGMLKELTISLLQHP